MPRLLVISPVHPPDDPRIRHKLIRTLQDEWIVTFAGVGRGPVDQSGMQWRELKGGRTRRWFQAGLLLRGRYDVASLHDPEVLPLGILASLFRRTIVFDVHENVPAQLRTKAWLPLPLRRPLAWLARRLLRVAERRVTITLAEAGYSELFRDVHPVFPNYLAGTPAEPRDVDPTVGVVYLGDVTAERGLALAVAATGDAGVEIMTIMGRCTPELRAELEEIAAEHGLRLDFRGFVTQDNALRIASGGIVGLSPLLDTPNYRDSLPTKVLEYLAVGIPTLVSDLPGTRKVVADKPGVVLVPAGEVAAWSEAIATAVKDAGLREDAQAGAAAIREGYVWPAAAVRTFYADLLET
jgi:glycosyltransferase involved in cell wall biosynthesis